MVVAMLRKNLALVDLPVNEGHSVAVEKLPTGKALQRRVRLRMHMCALSIREVKLP